MGNNLTVESIDFEQVENETGVATRSGIELLWDVANDEAKSRRTGVRTATERWEKKGVILSPSVNQNDLDTQFATVLRFDGAASVDLTGLQARPDFTIVILFVIGAGTITLKNASGSSIERNRIITSAAGDVAITTNRSVMLLYTNTRWREIKWM
mgnify:FL=1